MPVDPCRAGLVQEDVREHVREVARHGHQPVVRSRIDGHGNGAERGDEAVQELVALRLRLGHGREKPGRPVEELSARVVGAPRLGSADRMPADEALALGDRAAEAALRRADVGDGRARPRCQHGTHRLLQGGDRRGDEREIGALHPRFERVRRLVEGATLRRDPERVGVGVPAQDMGNPGPLRGEADRSPDQPRADQSKPLERHYVSSSGPRMSSASRKARSRDWRAFRRGSHKLM